MLDQSSTLPVMQLKAAANCHSRGQVVNRIYMEECCSLTQGRVAALVTCRLIQSLSQGDHNFFRTSNQQ